MVNPKSGSVNIYSELCELVLRTLNAAPNGAVDTAVLRFDNAIAPVPGGGGNVGLTAVTTANEGTIIEVRRQGLYAIQWGMSQIASTSFVSGLSVNATAPVTGDPALGVNGVLNRQLQTTPAATVMGVSWGWLVSIRPATLRAGVGGIARLRFHGTNNAGAAGGAAITLATAQIQIRRICGTT